MTNFILKSIYLALPVIVANSVPLLIRPYFKFLDHPLDLNKQWNNKPILGKNKTWRGLIFGTLSGILIIYLQKFLYHYDFFKNISHINYQTENILLIGFLLSFGALFGDAIKSLIKRQVGIKSGDRFFPWDQLDSLIGAGLLTSWLVYISLEMWLFYIVFTLLLHTTTNYISYKIGIKEVPW